eukprot:3352986-Amphidinium_carterae.2
MEKVVSRSTGATEALLTVPAWSFYGALPGDGTAAGVPSLSEQMIKSQMTIQPVSYTHLRAHETEADL